MRLEIRILIASLLSATVMLLFSSRIQPQRVAFRASSEKAPSSAEPAVLDQLADEPVAVINSESIQLEIGKETASIRRVIACLKHKMPH